MSLDVFRWVWMDFYKDSVKNILGLDGFGWVGMGLYGLDGLGWVWMNRFKGTLLLLLLFSRRLRGFGSIDLSGSWRFIFGRCCFFLHSSASIAWNWSSITGF